VWAGICQICLAELEEYHPGAPTIAVGAAIAPGRLRFDDVVCELRVVVELAMATDDGRAMADQGSWTERLMALLRTKFMLGTRPGCRRRGLDQGLGPFTSPQAFTRCSHARRGALTAPG
jgi:hypothetical protein